MTILVAGVGNLLRADDGFGVRVAEMLQRLKLPDGTKVVEVGTSGMSLVHELMARYDACIVADTTDRGGKPGTLYVLESVADSNPDNQELHRELVDMHYAEPSRALLLAQAVGVRPAKVYIVACQPAELDVLSEVLSPAVELAVAEAVRIIEGLIAKLNSEASEPVPRSV